MFPLQKYLPDGSLKIFGTRVFVQFAFTLPAYFLRLEISNEFLHLVTSFDINLVTKGRNIDHSPLQPHQQKAHANP
jgi:hypothetical protein